MIQNFFIFLVFLTTSASLYAQAKGNYDSEKSKGNYDYDKNVNYDNYNYNGRPTTAVNTIPNTNYPNMETMVFNIKGISNHKANDYVVIFSITQMAKTAEEADKLLQIRYDGFLVELQKLGIKKEDVLLDMISFVPFYEYDVEKKIFSRTTYNEVPKGFQIQQNVHIKYNNGNFISKIVSAAAKNEIYDIVKVDYFVLEQEQIKLELQQKCILFLNNKLKEFEKMGVKLDTMFHTVAEASFVAYPNERYSSYTAFSSASIENDRAKINNTKKTTTQFYDKIAFNTFDVVVNPTILEPEVQFMYDLKIVYMVKKPTAPAPPAKKEFLLLNPQGNTTILKLE
jgi:uncharacterized protein YggE